MSLPVGFIDGLNPVTLLMLGIVALLLFGERLPEVGKSLGRKFVEFKKNVEGIQAELRSAANSITSTVSSGSSLSSEPSIATHSDPPADDREEATAPKFVPPPEEPESTDA